MAARPLLLVRYRVAGGPFEEVDRRCEVVFTDGPVLPQIGDADRDRVWGIWTFGEQIDDALLDTLPGLRLVANFGVGVDGIDRDALARRGIRFAWPVGANAEAVADHAMALLLAVRHRIVEQDALVRRGDWEAEGYLPPVSADAHAAKVGIVGLGAIGRAFARRCHGFAMDVAYATPRPLDPAVEQQLGVRRMELDAMLAWADIVSLHCPLTDETRGLISRERLARMRPDAVLVNTARGGVVDQDALIEALVAGRLGAAGLDVFANEPHVPEALRALPHVVLTPHNADATPGAEAALVAHCAAETLAALDAS